MLRRPVESDLGAPGYQLPFPPDRAASWHLADHAHRHIEHQPRFRIVRLAEAHQLGVKLGAHLAREQVRPTHVRGLAEVSEAVADETLGQLGAREKALDRATSVSGVATSGEGGDVLQGGRVLLRRGQYLAAETAGTRMKAGPAMTLPVSSSTLARAI